MKLPALPHVVRCRGCRRQIGTARARHDGVFCTRPLCAELPAATEHEDRDAVIDLLYKLGQSRDALSERFSISKQRVSQIVSKRRERQVA